MYSFSRTNMFKVITKEEDRAILAYERYNHPRVRVMKNKCNALESKRVDDEMVCRIGITRFLTRSVKQLTKHFGS